MHKNGYHFVLIHGDCHGAWCWYKVATLLRCASHKVTALDMAGCGTDLKRIEDIPSITDYLKPLMLFMEAQSVEERVILVGHSRGGIDISVAMERFPEKIAAAVFVAAAMPGPDLDLPTISKEFEGKLDSPMDNKYIFSQDEDKHPTSYLMGTQFLASKLYQLSPPEDLTLATLLDKLMKEEMQRWLIDKNPPEEVRVVKGSDHMVMMSKPHDLCSCLLEIGSIYC